MTGRVRRVKDYVNMQIGGLDLPENVRVAVTSFLAAGGDPDLLCEQLRLLDKARTSPSGTMRVKS